MNEASVACALEPALSRESTSAPAKTIALRYARKVLACTALRGVSPATVCAAAGVSLPAKADASMRIPADDFVALWRSALRLTNDPELPFAVGVSEDDHSDDVIFHACLSSNSLLEALQKFVRYLPLWTNTPGWSVRTRAEAAAIVFHGAGRWNTEFSLACMIARIREYTGTPVTPREVHCVHSRPPTAEAYRRVFGCPVHFSAVENQIVIDKEVLAIPLVKASAGIAAYFSAHIEEELARTSESSDWCVLVRQEIANALPMLLSLAEVARRLGLSERTLRRRLEQRSAAYQTLLDEVRATFACRLLRDGNHSIAEVSYRLGYSEPSAFHRAFRRWTGLTPQQFMGQRLPSEPTQAGAQQQELPTSALAEGVQGGPGSP